MRVVIQRCKHSSVEVDGQIISEIDFGLNLLVCLEKGDDRKSIEAAAAKILKMRIFSDENQRMNKSIIDVGGKILAVSQFTLSWRGTKGNRPSFDNSMAPDEANTLFNDFCDLLAKDVPTLKGQFGAMMNVKIENDGPVTFAIDF